MSNEEFITIVKNAIYENCSDRRIIPSLLIAHAAISSNWGRHEIAVHANNLYRVKGNLKYNLPYYTRLEKVESGTGKCCETTEVFYRAYRSWRDSVLDYITRLMMKEPYQDVGVSDLYDKNLQLYCHLVRHSDWESFYNKMTTVIREHALTQYDDIQGNHNPYGIAQIGDYGEMVKWIQYELAKSGYRSTDEFIDGFYDYQLMMVVEEYQNDHNLEPTGAIDLITFKTLASTARI